MTGDILLADRALNAGATVLAQTGEPFCAASIGGAVVPRAIMAELRAGKKGPLSGSGGGPVPFRKDDHSWLFVGTGPGVGAVGALVSNILNR